MMAIESIFIATPGYFTKTQLDFGGRVKPINWLIGTHMTNVGQQESLSLLRTILIVSFQTLPHSPLHIVAAALYLPTKFEEIYGILIERYCNATESPRLTQKELRSLELEMVQTLRFPVNPPLLNHFFRRCSKAAGATANLHNTGKNLIKVRLASILLF
jgi:hypothetical protein